MSILSIYLRNELQSISESFEELERRQDVQELIKLSKKKEFDPTKVTANPATWYATHKIRRGSGKVFPSKGKTSLTQDFVGGIDPFGVWTSQYGARNQRAKIPESSQALKQVAGVTGGAVGGGLLVPSVIGGIIGASRGKGMSGIARGFKTGFKRPVGDLLSAIRARKVLGRKLTKKTVPDDTGLSDDSIAKGIKLDRPKDQADISKIVDRIPASKMDSSQVLRLKRSIEGRYGADPWLPEEAIKELRAPVKEALREGGSQLALGGVVGSVGAGVQYQKGRGSERRFQTRLKAKR